jgi:hypothetical protein
VEEDHIRARIAGALSSSSGLLLSRQFLLAALPTERSNEWRAAASVVYQRPDWAIDLPNTTSAPD